MPFRSCAPTRRRRRHSVCGWAWGTGSQWWSYPIDGSPPHVALGEVAHREERARQLGLAQDVQDVALVLGLVGAAAQLEAVGAAGDAGVVAGGHGVEPEQHGPAQEAVELQVPVALDAGVRGAAGRVVGHVGSHHVLVEVVGEREHVVGDAELLGHPPGVVDVGHRAAPRVTGAAPQLEGGADHLVALLLEQGGGHRRVDPTAHADQDPHGSARPEAQGGGGHRGDGGVDVVVGGGAPEAEAEAGERLALRHAHGQQHV